MSELRDDLMVWLDLEMTGLDPQTCVIVQLAMVLTDSQLEPIVPPLELTLWQPESALANMVPFVRAMHEKTGLLAKVRKSEIDVADATAQVMDVLTRHCARQKCVLAGNSVWQDRRFLIAYMAPVDAHLHYRNIDVSTLKELAQRWHKVKFEKSKDGQHTALFDVQQSIAELKFYRRELFPR